MGGRRVEVERKRERGPWARWLVVGAAAAQPRRALPRDSGERWGRRDAVDVADRWAGT
jgi:hypothetical protein